MTKRISIFSITFASILLLPSLLNAMSFSVNRNYMGYNLIYASGHIRYGDLYSLKRKYNSLSKSRQTVVVFNSEGGELKEGLKIGRFLKNNQIGSAVRRNGICASSCALAFLGGRAKSGAKLMILPDSSKLGYHSFYYRNGNYVRLTKVQKDVSNILNYASYVGAPSYLMAKMFDTKSSSMYFINSRDKYTLGISKGLRNVNLPSSSPREYVSKRNTPKSINRTVTYTTSAISYIRSYLRSYNTLIASNSGSTFYSNNTALNNNGYHSWLTQNLRYIHLNSAKSVSSNVVEAKVIYHLKSGERVCSTNRYTLSKTYSGEWKILKKNHKSCNHRYRKLLKNIARALP